MITRYAMSWATDEDEFVYVSPIESAKGNWVKWDDYARLQTELASLRASSFVTAVPVEQYERVVKAGDAVCESPYLWENDPAVIAWRAAKEGKPSA